MITYNTYHRTIKMEPIDFKKSTYIDFDVKNNDKNSEFHVSYQMRMSKCKNIFANFTLHIGQKKFVLKISYREHT